MLHRDIDPLDLSDIEPVTDEEFDDLIEDLEESIEEPEEFDLDNPRGSRVA